MALVDIIKKGSTSRSVPIYVFDNTTGLPKTGLLFNSAGIDLWYRRAGAAQTSITEVTSTLTAYNSGGFVEVANGDYELDIPDAALATGAQFVDYGGTLTGNTVVGGRIRLIDVDLEIAGGAAGGLLIAGTNAPVTITGSGDALTLTSTGANGNGMAINGNGTGDALVATGGATGHGLHGIGGATSGHGIVGTGGATTGNGIRAIAQAGSEGMRIQAAGAAAGMSIFGGTNAAGLQVTGGATSGAAIRAITISGDAVSLEPVNGHGLIAQANGTSKHGILAVGGTAGVSDGLKATAGSGGADIRGLLQSANVTQFNGTAVSMTGGGFPQVDVVSMQTAVVNQIRDAIANLVVDDSALASAAAITTQVTLKAALSLCTAFAAGRSQNSGQTFLTIDNVRVRIAGTATGNNRTVIVATPSG